VHRISTIVVGVAAESYEQVLIWKYFLPWRWSSWVGLFNGR
jgi:hypothetical protein